MLILKIIGIILLVMMLIGIGIFIYSILKAPTYPDDF